MIILDTCSLLWLAADQRHLSETAIKIIESNKATLFVSSISAFEIAVKCRSGKLKLPLPAIEWFSQTVEFHGIREIPVTSDIAIISVQLPLHHNDPCDRIIIATASINNMGILTCDRLISQYKHVRVIW